jgi:hypothetical protein
MARPDKKTALILEMLKGFEALGWDRYARVDARMLLRRYRRKALRIGVKVAGVLVMAALAGCTVRGGWPRFLRPGEAPGWHGPDMREREPALRTPFSAGAQGTARPTMSKAKVSDKVSDKVSLMPVMGKARAAGARSVTLVWDASADATVVGYNVYYGGASGNYTNTIDAVGATNATVGGLVKGRTYYFAATAYTAGDGTSPRLESPFSNEASWTAPMDPVNNSIALTVQAAGSAAGPWEDLPVAWVLPSQAAYRVFRVLIEPTNQ